MILIHPSDSSYYTAQQSSYVVHASISTRSSLTRTTWSVLLEGLLNRSYFYERCPLKCSPWSRDPHTLPECGAGGISINSGAGVTKMKFLVSCGHVTCVLPVLIFRFFSSTGGRKKIGQRSHTHARATCARRNTDQETRRGYSGVLELIPRSAVKWSRRGPRNLWLR